MNVRTWLAVSVYMVIVQAFVALTDGVGPHTGERRFKCRHNFGHTLYMKPSEAHLLAMPCRHELSTHRLSALSRVRASVYKSAYASRSSCATHAASTPTNCSSSASACLPRETACSASAPGWRQ